ncbi:MAG: hypothetical protein K8R59_01375, partial [Thermoanaerobaculales bacterium]|nr:hypothetical protein [Thermoanaerobaculales bacterium]
MENHRATAVGWYHATAAAILPWVGVYRPEWLPIAILMVVVVHRAAMRSAEGEPWRSLGIGVSALGVLVLQAGWAIAGAWLVLAVALGSAVLGLGWLKVGARPDVFDLAAAAVWATVMAIRPELLTPEAGGWIAPLLLVLGVRRGISRGFLRRSGAAQVLGPPSREVRGTLGFSGVVAGSDGLAR